MLQLKSKDVLTLSPTCAELSQQASLSKILFRVYEKIVSLKKYNIACSANCSADCESSKIISDFCPITNTKILCKTFYNSLSLCSSITLKNIVQPLVMTTEFSSATKASFLILLMMWKTVDYLANSFSLTKVCLFLFEQISSKYTQKTWCLLIKVWLYKLVHYFSLWTEFLLALIGPACTLWNETERHHRFVLINICSWF